MVAKEFDLSEKIKERKEVLEKEIEERNPEKYICKGIGDDNENHIEWNKLKAELKGIEFVEKLNKEFIKRVKEIVNTYLSTRVKLEKIEKLAGKSLVGK